MWNDFWKAKNTSPEMNLSVDENTEQLSTDICAGLVCSGGLDHGLSFLHWWTQGNCVEINSRTCKLDFCQSVQERAVRRPVSMETQTGHETALRWILCVAAPAELVHLGFIFFLVYIFLFLFFFHFLPHCSAAGPESDFFCLSFSFIHLLFLSHWQVAGLRFRRRQKVK